MKRIYLIDSPGVVYPTGDSDTEIVLKGVVSSYWLLKWEYDGVDIPSVGSGRRRKGYYVSYSILWIIYPNSIIGDCMILW